MSLRRAGCITVLAFTCVLSLKVGTAECITVRPAAFDHVVADVPREVMAGVGFEVAITFVDRYGNPMADTWKPETSLTLHVSQPASVQPSILTPDNYVQGFRYSVTTEKIGELTLSLRDDKGRVIDRWDLTIKSGRPVKILMDLPTGADVGEPVTMSFKAVDAHGNIAYGYVPEEQSLALEDSAASFAGPIESRGGGQYTIPVKFRAHGKLAINLRDRKRGLTGTSGAVNVKPAPLGSFRVEPASDQSVAGKEVALVIRALDRYGNLVTDYASRFKGVRIFSKDAQVTPDLVPPSSFSDGVARVGVVLKSAGPKTVQVSELQSNISGEFPILILPAEASNLRIRTPDAAVAGEPFEITISLEDAFGNRAASLPAGSIVRLNSTGTGTLRPDVVQGSSFKEGVAVLAVSYEKAESFEITADLESGGLVTGTPAPGDDKEKARLAAQKAREEAMRARRESRLREKRVSEKMAAAPPRSAKRETDPQIKSPPQPAGTREQAKARVQPKPAVTKPEPAKPSQTPPPVVASAKPLRPGILDRITVSEEEKRAMVTFSTNGMTDYNVTTSAKLSRKWIDIEFPDMTIDLPDRIAGGEKIVGEVYVEPSVSDGPGVRVSVEILPTRIGYDVYQEGQSLILKVNMQ